MLTRLLQGDLDWIAMKCLEKDWARRYETASTLEQDIHRYLAHEPLLAGPPGTVYRLGKFLRRHRTALAMVAVVWLVLIAGAMVSTWQAVRATRAERTQSALRQKAEAESVKRRQVAQFLTDMLEGVEPSVALGRDTTMLREVLDRTAARIAKELQAQPEVESELRKHGWRGLPRDWPI